MTESPYASPEVAPHVAPVAARPLSRWLGVPLLLGGAVVLFFDVAGLAIELELAWRASPPTRWVSWIGEWITPAGVLLYVGVPAVSVGWASVRRRARPRLGRVVLWLALLPLLMAALGTVRALTRRPVAPIEARR